jgi:hypothetical protein
VNNFIVDITSLAPILIVCLCFSCTAGSAKRQTAFDATVKALRKIEASTQAGVNYQQYSQLIIDAKTQIDESSVILSEYKLKQDISWVMDAYVDAGTLWGKKIKGNRSLYDNEIPGNDLITKYSLKTKQNSHSGYAWQEADIDESMQEIWRQAAQRLNEIANAGGQLKTMTVHL